MKRYFVIVLSAIFATVVVSAENTSKSDDKLLAADHPLIERYPGAVISHYTRLEDDTYNLPLSPMRNGSPERMQQLVGRVFRITYDSPEKWSTAATYEGFARTLENAGFSILFSAAGQELADTDEWPEFFYKDRYYLRGSTREQRFLSAKLSRDRDEVYATLYVSLGWYTHAVAQLEVIEVRKQQSKNR